MGVKDVMLDVPLTAVIAIIILVILLAVFFMIKGEMGGEELEREVGINEDLVISPFLLFLTTCFFFIYSNKNIINYDQTRNHVPSH